MPREAADLIGAVLADSGDSPGVNLRFRHAQLLAQAGDATTASAELGRILAEFTAADNVDALGFVELRAEHARSVAAAGDAEQALRQFDDILAEARELVTKMPDRGRRTEIRARCARAECLALAGRSDRALKEWRELAKDAIRIFGRTDSFALTVRHRLAHAEAEDGTITAAADEQQRLVDDLIETVDPDDPRLTGARLEAARYWGLSESPQRAVEQLTEAVALAHRHGAPQRQLFEARENLAKWLGRSGRPDLACRDYERLLQDQRAALGGNHPDVLITRYQLIHWTSVVDRDFARQRASLEALLPDAVQVGEHGQVATLCKIEILVNRRLAGEDVEQEAVDLLDQLNERGGGDGQEGLHLQSMLLSARLLRGDLSALREVRALLRRTEGRYGSGHPVAQVLRHNLKDFATPPGPAAL